MKMEKYCKELKERHINSYEVQQELNELIQDEEIRNKIQELIKSAYSDAFYEGAAYVSSLEGNNSGL